MSEPSTADLCDADDRLECCEVQFRSLGRPRFSGPIRTVRCHRDNALLRSVLAGPGGGAVLVIDGGGALGSALVGDVIAGMAAENGWSGLVVYGAVRDSEALDALPLGIKALGSNPRRSGKSGTGEVDVPVTFGGATFRPGDMLWSDADGIVAGPPRS